MTTLATLDRPRRRRWPAATAAVLLTAAGVAFSRFRDVPPRPGATEPAAVAAEVKTVKPVRRTIRKVLEQPGRIEGYEQSAVFVKLPGFVEDWRRDIGERVEKGDVLAVLSVPEEREELKRREASARLAEAEVTAADKSLDAAKADLTKADALVRQANATKARTDAGLTRWKAEFARVERARGGVSQTDVDATRDSFNSAEAAQKEALAGIDSAQAARVSADAARAKAEANVTVAKAKLAVAEADARKQAEWLKYATVTAPFAGVVAQRNVDRGQYVTPPASGAAQTPLFVVVRTDPVRVFADVPETEAALVAEGMQATVRVQAQEDREISAQVTRSSWALDQYTRTLRVQIDLANADGRLRPGMFATARLELERPGAWVVPAGSVTTSDEQPYVVRFEDGKGVKTPVKLGRGRTGSSRWSTSRPGGPPAASRSGGRL